MDRSLGIDRGAKEDGGHAPRFSNTSHILRRQPPGDRQTVRQVRKLLSENHMSLVYHDGANLLSCLVPTVINSSAELTYNPETRKGRRIQDAILALDTKVASIVPSAAAVSVVVAKAT